MMNNSTQDEQAQIGAFTAMHMKATSIAKRVAHQKSITTLFLLYSKRTHEQALLQCFEELTGLDLRRIV